MKNSWKVAQWEILRNLTNKQFIIGLLITPLIMALFIVVPVLLERWNQPATTTYYVVDELGAAEALQAFLPENIVLEKQSASADLAQLVKEGKARGYFILDESFPLSGQLDLFYSDRNTQSMNTQVPLEEELEPEAMHLVVSSVFAMLIFFLIFSSAAMLMQSALQEKRDRMAEVVLSSIRPSALMQGKIIGHFILGLIQLGFWLVLGLPLAIYFLDFSLLEALRGVNLAAILFFGLGGYLLYSALFVGLGATMEDVRSAGNAQGLVVMLPMLAFLFIGPVFNNPDGSMAVFASIFPLTSSTIMMLRSGLTVVPLWQLLTSGALLLVTSYAAMRAAAKIFRVGMLMYGKSATPKEILRWLRYKES